MGLSSRARIGAALAAGSLLAAACAQDADCGQVAEPCTQAGELRCAGDRVQRCAADARGCLAWQAEQDCAASGLRCEDGECIADCEHACEAPGAARCEGGWVERCEIGETGCRVWRAEDDCEAAGQVCREIGGLAQCVSCDDDCGPEGASRCEASRIQACSQDADGCLRWIDGSDCAAGGDPLCADAPPGSPARCIGDECGTYGDCGARGDAVCTAGRCQLFGPDSGYGSALVDLSFDSQLYDCCPSGLIYFFLSGSADGRPLGCADLLGGAFSGEETFLNPLRPDPRVIAFRWENGGTYFRDFLIQFIRPAADVLVVATGLSRSGGQGEIRALGCLEGVSLQADQSVAITISMGAN
ncbi:MAG: hypothetical protein JXR96_21290 [Deltaproteobacteria bacterium]|nr:hypothetical protein [Deltaproteobacteria bacterium]